MSSDTVLLVCDIQERFAPVIHGWTHLLSSSKFLLEITALLGVQVLITEQYPKGLGNTVLEVKEAAMKSVKPPIFGEKMDFSCFGCPVVKDVLMSTTQTVILIGLEAHVCVLQTCLDMFAQCPHVRVLLPVDAVSSSRPFERAVALKRLATLPNVALTTCESVAFELTGSASHPHFKVVSALVKSRNAALYAPVQAVTGSHGEGVHVGQASAGHDATRAERPPIQPVLCTLE